MSGFIKDGYKRCIRCMRQVDVLMLGLRSMLLEFQDDKGLECNASITTSNILREPNIKTST
jgi:hypothetical protein